MCIHTYRIRIVADLCRIVLGRVNLSKNIQVYTYTAVYVCEDENILSCYIQSVGLSVRHILGGKHIHNLHIYMYVVCLCCIFSRLVLLLFGRLALRCGEMVA